MKTTNFISTKILSPLNILFVIALLSDLLSPLLIWKGIVPPITRWTSSIVIVVLIAISYFRMMTLDKIPAAMLAICAFLSVSVTVAALNGQGVSATIWGLWLMFKYPLIGIYFYLQPSWPEKTPQYFRSICTAILTFEVLVQIVQYLTGEPIGDHLAGTFGKNGTGPLVNFALFVLCLTLGQWMVDQHWKNLCWVMALGIISSVLGEIKFFLPMSLGLLSLGIVIFVVRSGQVWKLIPYTVLLGAFFSVFIIGYNTFIPEAKKTPIESFIMDSDTLDNYVNRESQSINESGYLIMGRSRAVEYGWETMTRDPITFIFGMGIGARSESRSLGIAGIAFSRNGDNYITQSSLLVLMQETGLLGLLGLGVLILWIVFSQLKGIKLNLQSPVTELRYALLLFSLLWPVWLYYSVVWNHEVVMMLYWTSLGYVVGKSNQRQAIARMALQVSSNSNIVELK
jgi:hypothetical protein